MSNVDNGKCFIVFNPTMKSQDGHFYNYDTAIAKSAAYYFNRVEIYADCHFIVPHYAPCPIYPTLNIIPIAKLKTIANRFFGFFKFLRNKPAQINHANSSVVPEVPMRVIKLGRFINFCDIVIGLIGIIRQKNKTCSNLDILIEHAHIGEVKAVYFLSRYMPWFFKIPVKFHMVMRYTPDMMFPGGEVSYDFLPSLQFLINTKQPATYFYTDSEQLSSSYRTLTGNDLFVTLPIPVLLNGEVEKNSGGNQFCLSLLGPPRLEKGFDMLPEIFDSIKKIENLKLAVQTTKNPTDQRVAGRTKWLHELAASTDRVEILQGPASEEVYFSWFKKTDILLLPYISPRYASSTSGIFVEALYFLTPIITTSDTWMAKQIEEAKSQGLKIGEIVADFSEFGSKAAIIIQDMARYRTDMKQYLAQWKKFHSADNLVSMLVEK